MNEGLKQMLKDKKRGYIGKEGKTGVPLHLDESVDPSGRLGVVGVVAAPTRLTKPLFATTAATEVPILLLRFLKDGGLAVRRQQKPVVIAFLSLLEIFFGGFDQGRILE